MSTRCHSGSHSEQTGSAIDTVNPLNESTDTIQNDDETQEDSNTNNPYGYWEQGNSFGFKRKGVYYPKSDFSLTLLHFVEAKSSAKQLTGYTCSITREVDNESRYADITI